MTVDKEELISALVEQTGMERGYVDQQFQEMVEQIRQAEARQSSVDIEQFGTFTVEEGELEFLPCELLQTEINNKYVGMKPIELLEAFKEPAGEEVPVTGAEEEKLRREEEPAQTGEQEQPEPSAEEAPPADETPEGSEDAVVAEAEPETERKPFVADKESSAATEEPADEADDSEPVPGPADTAERKESLDADPIGKAVVIIVVILTLAIAGWLAYDFGLFGTDDAASPPVEQHEEQQNGAAQQPASGDPMSEQQQSNGQTMAGTALAAGSAEEQSNDTRLSSVKTEKYGLYGTFNDEVKTGYYTIVVHSLRTMKLAKQKKQGLVDEGFRTKIEQADVNGRTYFRVGIGQFATVKAAQQAVRELPEPYHSNNFINRF